MDIEISGRNSEGEEAKIVIDDGSLPDGLMSAATVSEEYVPKSVFERQGDGIEKRLGKAKAKAVEEYLAAIPVMEDEDLTAFLSGLKTSIGPDRLRESLGFKPVKGEAEVQAERERTLAQFRKTEVEPLNTMLEVKDARIGKLLDKSYAADFRAAAGEVGVIPGFRPMLESHYLTKVVYSEEHDEHFIRGADGEPVFSPKRAEANLKAGTPNAPAFKSIFEDLSEVKAGGSMAQAFSADVRDGVDFVGAHHTVPTKTKPHSEMSTKEKTDFITEHGSKAWEAHVGAAAG